MINLMINLMIDLMINLMINLMMNLMINIIHSEKEVFSSGRGGGRKSGCRVDAFVFVSAGGVGF